MLDLFEEFRLVEKKFFGVVDVVHRLRQFLFAQRPPRSTELVPLLCAFGSLLSHSYINATSAIKF